MRIEIDRGRWPILITYSDEGQGHTGHVYKCSGWMPTKRSKRPVYTLENGRRASVYSNGKTNSRNLVRKGFTWIQRWEHWICERGVADKYMSNNGWIRTEVPNKKWRSGNPAFTYELKID